MFKPFPRNQLATKAHSFPRKSSNTASPIARNAKDLHEVEGAVQIPHPLEDSDNQIPSFPGRQRCQMPGVRPGGGGKGMLKLRFDRYIISLLSISLSLSYKYSPLATSTSVNNCYLKGYTLSPSTDPTSFSLPTLQMLFTEYLAYPSFWLIAPSLA